ncbi:MAG: YybH family protein [Burkholderiales bacterium]
MSLAVAVAVPTVPVVPALAQNAPPAPLPSIALPPELDRVLRDYEQAWRAADAKVLTALFTEDGFVPTSGGWVRGHDAIRRAYEHSGGDLQLRALAFAVQDTVGYIVGAYGYGDPAAGRDAGKFVLALRRASAAGPWLIAADLDSSNRH